MAEDLKRFLDKWGFIYDNMGEIRQMEIDDIAEKCAADLTAEQVLRAEEEFAFAERINEALNSDEKLQKKMEEMKKEIYDKKTGAYIKRQEDYEYLRKIVYKRRTEVEREVLEKCCPDIEVLPDEEIVREEDFSDMKSAEEVLLESIEDYKESLVPFPKVDLPDIDIDAVFERFRVEHGLQGDRNGVKRKQFFDTPMTGKVVICYSMSVEAEGPTTCRKGDFDVKGIKKCRNRETGKTKD